MVRTQIQLTEEQANRLKAVAAERGVSMANVIRDAVDKHLERLANGNAEQRALAGIGRFSSGQSKISEQHDDAFADSVHDW